MPPVVIAGGIAAAGAIGGAVIGSSAQKSAAKQANQAQQAATNSQLQLGRESMGLNRDIYNSNYDVLSPYASRGNVAGDALNSLLGLGAAPAMHSPLAGTPSAPSPTGGAPAPSYSGGGVPQTLPHPTVTGGEQGVSYTATPNTLFRPNPAAVSGPAQSTGTGHPALDAVNASRASRGLPPIGGPPSASGSPAAAGGASAGAGGANSALNNFANSAGMQFQLQQGTNALNNMYAAHGMLQSGAAMKGIQNYGQQTALNNYFMPYMSLLGGQQAVGAGAASSIAGVGQNFGNTAANINGQMGNAIQGGADSASAAAIARGNANGQMWGQIGNSLGQFGSSFLGGGMPSYSSGTQLPVNINQGSLFQGSSFPPPRY